MAVPVTPCVTPHVLIAAPGDAAALLPATSCTDDIRLTLVAHGSKRGRR